MLNIFDGGVNGFRFSFVWFCTSDPPHWQVEHIPDLVSLKKDSVTL